MIDKLGNQKHLVIPVNAVQKPTEVNLQEPKQEETTETAVRKPEKAKMEKIVQGMNDFLKPSNTHLKFEFHDELEEYYVTMIDDETQEVIREIPSKKLLDMYAAMTDYLGILVDKKI
ncbi:flagellar protein FlaG [Bacillus sp. FJAT-27231]|uniref:flagellar protein FlaG n=1 Tax=Bacillus sp. FJAT-27231 TaxID=1679168 RepID=UPI0009E62431|nr:flagellar protein FlaG [Bacillus sp. FJAT-27231]